MIALVETLNFWFGLGTVIAQVAAVLLLLLYFFRRAHPLLKFVTEWAIPLSFVIVLVSTTITLLYSEVFGFIPCGLCWLQRVFLYPQVVILGLAWWKGDGPRIADYVLSLSVVGGLIALYQHYLQLGGSAIIGCPVAGGGADCAKRYVFEFGYITFPLMSFTIFALIAILMLILRRYGNTS